MAFGRDADGNYQVTVLVQSADYVQLGMDDVNAIESPLAVTAIETVTGTECLSASSFTCGQIFTATIPAQCAGPNSTVDLGGNYQFSFTPQCRANHEPVAAYQGSTDYELSANHEAAFSFLTFDTQRETIAVHVQ